MNTRLRLIVWCVLIGLALGHGVAHATRQSTAVQSPAPAIFTMGSAQTLSYQVTNTSTGGNAGERIYQMQFSMSTITGVTHSKFSCVSIVPPAGWTVSACSPTSVTFRASSWANAIAVGGASVNFAVVLNMRSTTADGTETYSLMRASYTLSTTLSNRSGRATPSGTKSWTLLSLAITSFKIFDLSGVPITALLAGGSFRLVMEVTNVSSVTQSGIISSPNPPGATKTGTVTQSLTGTVGSPLTLAATAKSTITFTFSTAATDNGTIYFTAFAKNATATATSLSAISTTLTVAPCILAASFTAPASSSCLYPGSNFTLTLALTNNCAVALTNLTPTLATTGPASKVSGATPAIIASLAAGASAPVSWTYTIDPGAATNPFTFTGGATSAAPGPALTAPTATSPTITPGGFPTVVNPLVTNASSTNVELTWTVTSSGCAAAKSVAITIPAVPAGWVWANDAYSLVDLSATNSVETWVASGANPVTFASPDIPNQMPPSPTLNGDFSLVFSATPASAGTSTFKVNVTDANGVVVPVSVPVTVNPFDPIGLNNVTNGIRIWREQFP